VAWRGVTAARVMESFLSSALVTLLVAVVGVLAHPTPRHLPCPQRHLAWRAISTVLVFCIVGVLLCGLVGAAARWCGTTAGMQDGGMSALAGQGFGELRLHRLPSEKQDLLWSSILSSCLFDRRCVGSVQVPLRRSKGVTRSGIRSLFLCPARAAAGGACCR
jgi:hypothetical protein